MTIKDLMDVLAYNYKKEHIEDYIKDLLEYNNSKYFGVVDMNMWIVIVKLKGFE